MATTIDDVIKFIWSADFNDAARNRIVTEFRAADAYRLRRAASRLGVGMTVTFPDKLNRTVEGEVTKVNRKTVFVVTKAGAKWRVSPNLCNIVQDK